MVEPKILRSKTSMVLYDGSQLNGVPEAWFQESFWQNRDAVLTTVSGRGSVFVLDSQPNTWVLLIEVIEAPTASILWSIDNKFVLLAF